LFALVGLADDGALRVELWIIGIGARERLLDCFGRCRGWPAPKQLRQQA